MAKRLYSEADKCPNHPEKQVWAKGLCQLCYNRSLPRYKYLRKSRYGLTDEEVQQKYKEQDGRCAICRKPLNPICIDHNHQTKKPRGLLCQLCNRGIGHFKDEPSLLRQAANYLEEYETT